MDKGRTFLSFVQIRKNKIRIVEETETTKNPSMTLYFLMQEKIRKVDKISNYKLLENPS
jgi:hypothetical protein